MLFLARGIEDHHYGVVEEVGDALVETPWRIEREGAGYRLSHADDAGETVRLFELGEFNSPDEALAALAERAG
ncbi:hypothetical protein [Herbiconiux sp. VKM Ac-2851]|uniref:hypothetical protein n=1 Tax=Herbiconiux sp. VKM Ac-2851 TaxID=2739025 RepID=UPI0015666D5B|nr:hypothetical protein [Herbiconiux sp. VKM Ac-2851]NQX37083.1 hypothetical protein [Herbiconiux sp. VKM Ac-2851]